MRWTLTEILLAGIADDDDMAIGFAVTMSNALTSLHVIKDSRGMVPLTSAHLIRREAEWYLATCVRGW